MKGQSLYAIVERAGASKRDTPTVLPSSIYELVLNKGKQTDAMKFNKEDLSSKSKNLPTGHDNLSGKEEDEIARENSVHQTFSSNSNTINAQNVQTFLRQQNNELEIKEPHPEILKIRQSLQYLAAASSYAMCAKSWIKLQNIVVFTVNLLNSEGLSPVELAEGYSWKYLALILENALVMIREIKKVGSLSQEDDQSEFGLVPGSDDFIKVENNSSRSIPVLDNIAEKKVFWFVNVRNLSVLPVANLLAFFIQVLMINQNWNLLIQLTKTFSNETNHYFSQQILPFTHFAQNILFEQAAEKTSKKEEDYDFCKEEYEKWR